MTITWSSRSLADLNTIADWLMPRSASGAASVMRKIERTVRLIEKHPLMGRQLRQRPSFRVMPIGKYPYLVYYSVRPHDVLILHIRHSARQPPRPRDLT